MGKNTFKNETLLHLAVKLNCTDMAKYLIENDLCDINKTHSFGYTALHMAVHQGNENLTELISIPSMNLHTLDRGGNTPFLLSAMTGNITIFNLLLFIHENGEKGNQFFTLPKTDINFATALVNLLKTSENQISQGGKMLVLDAVIRLGNNPVSTLLQTELDSMTRYLIEIRAFHCAKLALGEGLIANGKMDSLENNILSKLHHENAVFDSPNWSDKFLIEEKGVSGSNLPF